MQGRCNSFAEQHNARDYANAAKAYEACAAGRNVTQEQSEAEANKGDTTSTTKLTNEDGSLTEAGIAAVVGGILGGLALVAVLLVAISPQLGNMLPGIPGII